MEIEKIKVLSSQSRDDLTGISAASKMKTWKRFCQPEVKISCSSGGLALHWTEWKINIWQSQLGIDAGLVLALDNIKSSVRSTIKRNSSRQVSTCVCPQDTVLLPRRLAENCPWPAENGRPADNFLIQRGPRTSPCLPGLEIDLLLTLPNFTVTVLAQECDASSFCWY